MASASLTGLTPVIPSFTVWTPIVLPAPYMFKVALKVVDLTRAYRSVERI